MNYDDLTLKQIKEIKSLFGDQEEKRLKSYEKYIGEYVLVRSRNEGVNAGYVVECDQTGIVLEEARRLWLHAPKDGSVSWYEGVAISGLSEKSKVSPPVKKVIVEVYSITECSKEAEKSIKEYPSNEQ